MTEVPSRSISMVINGTAVEVHCEDRELLLDLLRDRLHLKGSREALSALQDAFWEHDGFQCGFCLPGQLFAADGLLQATEGIPDDATIRHAMEGNLCRCTGYQKTIDAIRAAAGRR